jgi:predicted TPR repeat methyltransferase
MTQALKDGRIFGSSGDLIADRRYQMARDLHARGDGSAAVDLLEQALERAPDFAAGWFDLGDWREGQGDRAGAASAFRRALAADPADRHGAGLRLALLDGASGAMSADYVRAVFDQYAPKFDAALSALSYRAPQLLAEAVRPLRARFSAMLDLGCGTGLAGEAFRPFVARLEGVDLSPGMVEQARRKTIYDALSVGEIGALLAQRAQDGACADLVVAADVFVYCADLAPLLHDAARILDPGGLLAFTVETHDGEGVRLGGTLRYAHAEPYVRDALAAAGLTARHLARTSTRNEAGAPVPGLVVVAGPA